ncbi:attractin isoform X3 [Anoplophora glabripennis]|uniref:attractin isoform X3 n=1 Tax=Anoplophora glabripennis TaxID=217634 RepID=UPI000873E241|nr:attractin isoform X3 [Anoplophora glabripennis]
MIESLQMFLFLFKSKYRRKIYVLELVIGIIFSVSYIVSAKCNDTSCGDNGVCKNETCVCYDGWQGPHCQFCGGKVRLAASSGTIHDGLGNYSLTSKCSWLIDAPNSTITLHIEEFATECGWDHLYVFDGDSVDSPLLAVLSGLMYKNAYSIRRIPEITTHSGSALIHFFSDDAYNMSGFNVSYRLNACPSVISGIDCSGNGICIEGICTCNGGWGGLACHLENCPNNCGASHNRGICEPEKGCSCFGKYKGDDCSQIAGNGFWEAIKVQGFIPPGSASHGAAVWRDSMYIIGGESYSRSALLYVYDFNGNVWETPHTVEGPSMRYGHSTVIYGDKIFLYGGVVGNQGPTSELWAFDISAKIWENVTVKAASCNGSYLMCGPLKSAGHTATVVVNSINKKADRMVVIFGHSPYLGYLNTVQEYYFGTREWHIINTKGFPVKGGYGHTASLDLLTGKIYVYGGIISESESAQFLSNSLYSYEPSERIWTLLAEAPSPRYLHTATFISEGLMLVFGGNTHNDTSHSFGAKCYSSELLIYDVFCDTWTVSTVPKSLNSDLARFGHSAVIFEGSLYIYGGFNGQMLSDILKYTPGDCNFNNETTCLSAKSGVKCVWDSKTNSCTSISHIPKDLVLKKEETHIICCPKINRSAATQNLIKRKRKCESMEDCLSCVQTTTECVWCSSSCTLNNKCPKLNGNITDLNPILTLENCPLDPTPICNQLHTCKACTSQPFCRWRFEHAKCVPHPLNSNISAEAIEPMQCQSVCSEYISCLNCTQEECIWCQNEGRCVDKNAYTSSFPYGQCREWTTIGTKCRTRGSDENSQCSFYKTCAKCRDDPACGWCDDGSKTGLGSCMPGGYGDDLTIDYQFTFNLSKKEDRHYTQINFRNSPVKADIDADFLITCSVLAKMNITIRKGNSPEEIPIHTNFNCTTFRWRFSKTDYNFGIEDNITLTTFYVYVYDFQPPLWIQISFSQYPKLNLQQFFITFSSCFLLLLLVAAILWKIKQRYDLYRRRQRFFVEMEQMASRPFSQVLVELEIKDRIELNICITDKKIKIKDVPSPIALEPCYGNRAAVLSLLVRLPTGGEAFTSKGQSAGLAVASALVTLGYPRKISMDQIKSEKSGKLRKLQSQHPDSCL